MKLKYFVPIFCLGVGLTASVNAQEQPPKSRPLLLDEQVKEYWISQKVAPQYPRRALRKGIQGCTTVAYGIQADGTTVDHKILVTSSKLFEKPSLDAARQFQYKPTERNAERIAAVTTNTFTYEISDGNESKRSTLADACRSKALEIIESLAD